MSAAGKQSRSVWPKVAIAIVALALVLGFGMNLPSMVLDKILGSNQNSVNNHHRLTFRSSSVNKEFFQARNPSRQEREAGKVALSKWPSASWNDRRYLIDDIILGNALMGLTYSEVESYLGKNAYENEDTSTTFHMKYRVPSLASASGLVLRMKPPAEEGQEATVDDVYLVVYD